MKTMIRITTEWPTARLNVVVQDIEIEGLIHVAVEQSL